MARATRSLAALVVAVVASSATAADDDAIADHLARVEADLRTRDLSHLPASTRALRLAALDHLRDYRERGVFPHNHSHPNGRADLHPEAGFEPSPRSTPVFVDEHGTHCAVGELIRLSGSPGLVQEIVDTQNADYVAEMRVDGLEDWAIHNGFLVEELARIQPSYPYTLPACSELDADRPAPSRRLRTRTPADCTGTADLFIWDGGACIPDCSADIRGFTIGVGNDGSDRSVPTQLALVFAPRWDPHESAGAPILSLAVPALDSGEHVFLGPVVADRTSWAEGHLLRVLTAQGEPNCISTAALPLLGAGHRDPWDEHPVTLAWEVDAAGESGFCHVGMEGQREGPLPAPTAGVPLPPLDRSKLVRKPSELDTVVTAYLPAFEPGARPNARGRLVVLWLAVGLGALLTCLGVLSRLLLAVYRSR